MRVEPENMKDHIQELKRLVLKMSDLIDKRDMPYWMERKIRDLVTFDDKFYKGKEQNDNS